MNLIKFTSAHDYGAIYINTKKIISVCAWKNPRAPDEIGTVIRYGCAEDDYYIVLDSIETVVAFINTLMKGKK